ncbi:MAG: ATP-binding protein [Verrucomicrobiae bacterium]|nr:ATP-binding protein [Verrucomicrobiae bacterium]
MKTLLVLTRHPALAEQLGAAADPAQYRVVHRASIEEAEPLLTHGLPDLCILDVESAQVQGLWLLEKIRRFMPHCPVLVYTGQPAWEWEEEAYLMGAVNFLRKPIRSAYLNAMLERTLSAATMAQLGAIPGAAPIAKQEPSPIWHTAPQAESVQTAAQSLKLMRDVWAVLAHSSRAEDMLKQFLLALREIIGVNRVALFVWRPAHRPNQGKLASSEPSRLSCAIGLPNELLSALQPSLGEGIAHHLSKHGRILYRDSPEIRADPKALREFELLCGQVAIPIFDRETLVGMAVFDRRLTGEPLSHTELELIFHLLERLGLTLNTLWLHEELTANNQILTEILRELATGCIVIDSNLKILNLNRAARRLLQKPKRLKPEPDFADLPQELSTKTYEVLKTGTPSGTFQFEAEDPPGTIYNISIVPLFTTDKSRPAAALLTAEDLTQTEKLKQLEIEAANLRLIKTIADRSAHDIGNALVPLSAHQQLLKQRAQDQAFINSLDSALADGVRRIARRVEQMRFLANDELAGAAPVSLFPLLEEAFSQAREHFRTERAELKLEKSLSAVTVMADRDALRWALFEIMLNALQANPADARIQVRVCEKSAADGTRCLQIEIEDNGPGFTDEALKKAGTPFWTRRTVGMGLGLATARKIIQLHHGELEIRPPKEARGGIVVIRLPGQTNNAHTQPRPNSLGTEARRNS